MALQFDKRLSIFLTLGFIAATAAGTLCHELGHYTAARILGYKAEISYGATTVLDDEAQNFIKAIYSKYEDEIKANQPFPEKEKYEEVLSRWTRDGFWVTLGGPLQTMLTGTIGLFLLFIFQKSFKRKSRLNFWQWVLIFIALFWLRGTANFAAWIGTFFLNGRFSKRGDEVQLAVDSGLPIWSLTAFSAAIGTIVLVIVVFKFVPLGKRLTFVIFGLIGGVSGYAIWLKWVGPLILP